MDVEHARLCGICPPDDVQQHKEFGAYRSPGGGWLPLRPRWSSFGNDWQHRPVSTRHPLAAGTQRRPRGAERASEGRAHVDLWRNARAVCCGAPWQAVCGSSGVARDDVRTATCNSLPPFNLEVLCDITMPVFLAMWRCFVFWL